MVFIRNMSIGCGFVIAAPIVAIVIGHLLAAYVPIDDPLFHGGSLEHWLTEVQSKDPAERSQATKILAEILTSPFDEPMNCHPLGGLDPSFHRHVRIARHHGEFVSRHVSRIWAALYEIATNRDSPDRRDAMRGLSYGSGWVGPDEQRRVLPVLIAACHVEDAESREIAIENLMQALSNFHAYKDYDTLPIADLLPIVTESLYQEQHWRAAVNTIGMIGHRAGAEVLKDLLRIQGEEFGERTVGDLRQIEWAMRRVRGEQ